MLLVTKAPASIVKIPDVPIKYISSILDNCDSVRGQWGNEENISFVGWVDMSVKIERNKKVAEVNVPFLVTTQKLNDYILVFNAIKYLVQNRNDIFEIDNI